MIQSRLCLNHYQDTQLLEISFLIKCAFDVAILDVTPSPTRDQHEWIWIIFGKNVAEKVGNQKVFYFPTSPN